MADHTIITQPGQCLEDLALQEYGSIDGVTAIVQNNPLVFTHGYSTDLPAGSVLNIVGEPLNVLVWNAMRQLGVVPATDLPNTANVPLGGDFNDDFSNDFSNY